MKTKILIADDEPRIRKVITLLLSEEGYETKAVKDGQEALDVLDEFNPDIILLDQQMPNLNGVEALEKIKEKNPSQIVIFISAFGSISLAVDAVRKGAYDFIEKPFDNNHLLLTIKRASEHAKLKGEINLLKSKLGMDIPAIIGENSGLRTTMLQVNKVAQTDATVLINGESGTGKELIARAIHHRSLRSGKPFITVNCGAIPLTLLESEFFGHERGAFTDAKEKLIGKFEQADGGTIFLDEIGELPLDAQVKFLRVLEERKITRLGGKKSISVNIRIIAATNRDLEENIREGKFRLDLFYRLNVFTVNLPPLKERKEDIPFLVNHFIKKHGPLLNSQIENIVPEALNILTKHSWPGNIRDLENAVQSALISATGKSITIEHLPIRVKENIEEIQNHENTLKDAIEINEKNQIIESLKKNGYNRTLTAESLNISRKTLFNKMRKYNINSN